MRGLANAYPERSEDHGPLFHIVHSPVYGACETSRHRRTAPSVLLQLRSGLLVISDDPDLLPSLAEWNSRIVSLSDAIMLEHECGHPSTHFVHDGTLTPYRRKKGLFSGWNAKASTVTKV